MAKLTEQELRRLILEEATKIRRELDECGCTCGGGGMMGGADTGQAPNVVGGGYNYPDARDGADLAYGMGVYDSMPDLAMPMMAAPPAPMDYQTEPVYAADAGINYDYDLEPDYDFIPPAPAPAPDMGRGMGAGRGRGGAPRMRGPSATMSSMSPEMSDHGCGGAERGMSDRGMDIQSFDYDEYSPGGYEYEEPMDAGMGSSLDVAGEGVPWWDQVVGPPARQAPGRPTPGRGAPTPEQWSPAEDEFGGAMSDYGMEDEFLMDELDSDMGMSDYGCGGSPVGRERGMRVGAPERPAGRRAAPEQNYMGEMDWMTEVDEMEDSYMSMDEEDDWS